MRRAGMALAVLLILAVPARAQLGKSVIIEAGSPEAKALGEIGAASDAAKKLELLGKFLAEFGQTDMAVIAYEQYITHYLSEKDYDKVFEYGEKLLAADPDNFNGAVNLVTAAKEKGDTARMFDYGQRIGAMVERYKLKPAPEGTDAAAWPQQKADTLSQIADNYNYVQLTLLTAAHQTADAAQKLPLLERYLAAFPDSQYKSNAQVMFVASLLLTADGWSERGAELDKAEEYATKALDVLGKMEKPAQVTDEQWQPQKLLQQGLAHSILGQVHVHKNRNAQAVEAFKTASPLLKAEPTTYARNLYRLGFTLAKMQKTAEARAVLTECVALNTPFKPLAQDLLSRIGGAVGKAPAKKRR